MKEKEMFATKMGELIFKARKIAKLSQEKLGEKIGVDMRTISNYESGKNVPSAIVIFKIAKALDIMVDDLVPNELKGRLCNEEEQTARLLKDLKIKVNLLIDETIKKS